MYNIVRSSCLSVFSRVWILDCTSHTWSEAPSLRVELSKVSASVLDGKIYVAGRYKDVDSEWKNALELLDTKTQIWDPVPSETKNSFYTEIVSVDGKLHVVTNKEVVAYDSKEGKWELGGTRMRLHMVSAAYCVIENVLYSASSGVFKWYDSEVRMWRDLKGLVGLPPNIRGSKEIRLADYGGKMVVLWDMLLWAGYYKWIYCAEIALERRNSCEIWGKVEWFDRMLTLSTSYSVEKVLAVTV